MTEGDAPLASPVRPLDQKPLLSRRLGGSIVRLVQGEPPAIVVMQNPPAESFTTGNGVNVLQRWVRCREPDGVGRGNGAFPTLPGQGRDYFVNTMNACARGGSRHSGIMEPVAAGSPPF